MYAQYTKANAIVTWHYELSVRCHAYFKAILYILDAAKLIHVSRNVDDSFLLVALCPFYCQA